MMINKPELLSPAGAPEMLEAAVRFGADAVYFGGQVGSLRADASGFSIEQIKESVEYCHANNCKAYLALNTIPHKDDLCNVEELVQACKNFGIDAFIVSDPAVMQVVWRVIADAEIHLSTQANVTTAETATFWHNAGVKRVVLARELSLEEIIHIRKNTPKTLELEAFVHGAMCISYSGRCLLSSYLTGRDGNRGECAQPCRWEYALVEKKRPDAEFEIVEGSNSTYIMNSKDLCLIAHLHELMEAGVISFKIEGRMKSVYYVATVTGAYRTAIDNIELLGLSGDSEEKDALLTDLEYELKKVSHREYTKAFMFGYPGAESQRYETSSYIRGYSFLGIVKDYDADTKLAKIEHRGKFSIGESLEIFGPQMNNTTFEVTKIFDEYNNPVESAIHPMKIYYVEIDGDIAEGYMLRRKD